jgi:hypothetical protein
MGSSGESSDSAWAHWLNAKATLDGNGNESGSISRRMANISSALLTGGPVMNVRLVFALFPLLFLGSPVYAQSPCSECLKAAEEERKPCIANAISAGDKISCEESQQAHRKVCSNGECKIERDESDNRNRNEQQTPSRPGLTSYTPTEIEWLALTMRASLRQEASTDYPYSLDIILVDHETLLIFVQYHPTVNREIMNRTIDTAREVIMSTAISYGWDKWVKIRKHVEMYPLKK